MRVCTIWDFKKNPRSGSKWAKDGGAALTWVLAVIARLWVCGVGFVFCFVYLCRFKMCVFKTMAGGGVCGLVNVIFSPLGMF